ncbi:Hypothetical protein NGAL_HAMBI2566_59880 [Neorhizobium galegae bv. orientalis]|nr:Hypothetical protein NGAL_HAMBI2566_59880 [Neorhizobium galegae bv. orientalis]
MMPFNELCRVCAASRFKRRETEWRESVTMEDMVSPSRNIKWTLADFLSTYRYYRPRFYPLFF